MSLLLLGPSIIKTRRSKLFLRHKGLSYCNFVASKIHCSNKEEVKCKECSNGSLEFPGLLPINIMNCTHLRHGVPFFALLLAKVSQHLASKKAIIVMLQVYECKVNSLDFFFCFVFFFCFGQRTHWIISTKIVRLCYYLLRARKRKNFGKQSN